jgi:hypothetical protein
MAAPAAGGGATIARDYFVSGFYPTKRRNPADALEPSASLLFAVLISGAQSMQGISAHNGMAIGSVYPNIHSGWGRLALQYSLPLGDTNWNMQVSGALLDAAKKSIEMHSSCGTTKRGGPYDEFLRQVHPPMQQAVVWRIESTLSHPQDHGQIVFTRTTDCFYKNKGVHNSMRSMRRQP